MKILFLHPNVPGQYKHLCQALARDPNNQVVFISRPRPEIVLPGVHRVDYQAARQASPYTHRYLTGVEKAVIQGQEVWRACKALKDQEGFIPDVVCAHPGWGDALYVKDIYPSAPLLSFFEFYYHATGTDVGFDPTHPTSEDDKARVRTKNITNLLNLEAADWGVAPTLWQWRQHPKAFLPKISVLHDGIDTNYSRPNPNAVVNLEQLGVTLKPGDEVVTYIARNFEPYRGFPTFMRAAKIMLEERPNLRILAVGADDVSYGRKPTDGRTYRQHLTNEVKLDYSRLHFTGLLPYDMLQRVMQISAAHIYLTYPFVLSWSMLEAMSTGCVMIGSKTPPVEEVITHGQNGFLVDFFSPESVARQTLEAVDRRAELMPMREAARQTVIDRFDINKLLPLHIQLVTDLAQGHLPPPSHKRIMELHA